MKEYRFTFPLFICSFLFHFFSGRYFFIFLSCAPLWDFFENLLKDFPSRGTKPYKNDKDIFLIVHIRGLAQGSTIGELA